VTDESPSSLTNVFIKANHFFPTSFLSIKPYGGLYVCINLLDTNVLKWINSLKDKYVPKRIHYTLIFKNIKESREGADAKLHFIITLKL